jgi:protoheme IX farnesyltransferase
MTDMPLDNAIDATTASDYAAGTEPFSNGPAFSTDAAPSRAKSASRWNDFYELTKPRMNFLVLATTMVGFYMAARTSQDWARLPYALVGTAMAAAAASIFNQHWEREYDALMPRTRRRPLVTGRVQPAEALLMGALLATGGLLLLGFFVNRLTLVLAASTVAGYVLVYTPSKRFTTLNTVIGAVPGAIPFAMGYTAVTGALSREALALFCILFVWQMPHFLAIAILYRKDYAAGGFRMLPVIDENLSMTGRQIVLYSITLIPVSLVPVMLNMAGAVYLTAAVLLGLGFLSFAISCATTKSRVDARKLFFASIIYLPLLMTFLMIDRIR